MASWGPSRRFSARGLRFYKGLKEAGIKAGEWVAVVGAPGGGSMAVQYAKAMGFRVLAVDGGGESEEKRRVCVGCVGCGAVRELYLPPKG